MTYDPAWDMPFQNWQQQGSFETPEVPPDVDPDAGTQVCIGPFAAEWLPYIQGAMDQLRNPSSWAVADDDAMYATLARVTRLKEIFGSYGPCVSYSLRYTDDCKLQYTVDGGALWQTVDGWDINFPACVTAIASEIPKTTLRLTSDGILQNSFDAGSSWSDVTDWATYFCGAVNACVNPIGPPPNPDERTDDAMACSIAAYITDYVLQPAIQKAIDDIILNRNLLQVAIDISDTIPEFFWTNVFINAVNIIYQAISAGTISDYESAMSDPTLWSEVRCAIYSAIAADGHVTEANFVTVLSNIAAISYAHPAVVTAIHDFVEAYGWRGLANLSQPAGLNPITDCSDCGGSPTWCYEWDFRGSAQGWVLPIPGQGHWAAGGFASDCVSGQDALAISVAFSPVTITSIYVLFEAAGTTGGSDRRFHLYSSGIEIANAPIDGSIRTVPTSSGWHPISYTCDSVVIRLNDGTCAGGTKIIAVKVAGDGINPFGDNNCTFS